MEFLPIFITLTIAFFIWPFIYLFILWKQRIKNFKLFKELGIPGPEPSVISGNLKELRFSKDKNVLEVISDWSKEYGPIFGFFAGSQPTVIVQDLEIIRDILIKNSWNFINRPNISINTKPLIHTLVGLKDQRWKDVRSILTPTFSGSKMRGMTSLMSKSVTETIEILDNLQGFQDIEILDLYQRLTCQVISECALAMKVDCLKDPKDKFLKAVRGFLANALNPIVYVCVCFPYFGYVLGKIVDRFALSGQMTEMICKNVKNVIKHRRENGHGHGGSDNTKDVLQLMMDASVVEGSELNLLDEEIIANAWVFVLGGFETTASALSFTTYLLATHSEIQDKLFEELRSTFGIDEIPTYEQVNSLVYLDQVVSESLRLYPPVVSFVSRAVQETSQLGPYTVPKGISIHVPIWQIHHNEELWPEPYKFDPDRFHPSNKNYDSMAYIPFGAGPRNCIGSRFGLLETKLALARIFRTFRFFPSKYTERNIQFIVPTVTLTPKNGIHVRCEKRTD